MDKVQPLLLQIADVRGIVLMPIAVTLPEAISKQVKCLTTNFHCACLSASAVQTKPETSPRKYWARYNEFGCSCPLLPTFLPAMSSLIHIAWKRGHQPRRG